MRKNIKKILALIFALVICVGGFGNIGQTEAAVNNVTSQAVTTVAGPQDDIQDGVTLHCWNWSYKNIEANMALIASLGYTAVQTSPIQQSKEGTKTYSMDAWWLFYQPMGFHIDNTGNSGLGTKAEFESMCKTAHEYGVKVIVDVVANHLGNQTSNNLSTAISSDIRDDSDCWHDITKNTSNYNSRYEITQWCMNGVPDLNTSNKKIQNYVIGFLKECIDAGADGFRFDAAKHIELPIDTDYCASDFWPTVINAATTYATQKGKELYCYGELLDSPGGGIPASAYTTYMSITDNSWGNQLRGNISAGNTSSYNYAYHKGEDVLADKLVLWAESHDTFAGGESKSVSQQNINKTWALVAARADAMGLYFARPSSTNLNNSPMGSASVTGWANAEVAAINKFHNAFVGQSEWVSNEGSISYCERGTSGVVLVNCSGTNTSVSVTANTMAAGTYKDQITGNTFTVANGKITGEIGGTGIAVVYNAASSSTTTTTKNIAYLELPSGWSSNVYCYAYNDSDVNNGDWPGVLMTKVSGNLYQYEVPSSITNPKVIFYSSDTNRYPADMEPGLSLWGSMIYKSGQWSAYSTGEDTSGGDTSGGNTSGGDTSGGNTSGGDTSGGNTSGGDISGGNTSGGNTSGGNSSGGDTSGGNTSGGDTTGGNTSGGDSSGDNAGGEDTSSDNSSGDNDSDDTDKSDDNGITDDGYKETDADNSQSGEDDTDNNNTQGSDNGETDTPLDEEADSNTSSADEATQTGDADNNEGNDNKKFPWPAVIIPICVLAVGAGVFVYIKNSKNAEG